MKIFNKASLVAFALALGLIAPMATFAATTPSLGTAATYGILSNIYNNAVPGTTINGDVGFTTGPAVAPAGTHTNYGSGAPYPTAVLDAGSALSNLNGQACTFTFAPGAVDLATDATHGPVGVYTPGVYCVSATVPFVSLGASGITLSGSGTYIFRVNGSLTTAASSVVTLTNGASACDVFWTLTDNAIISTLGANSTFFGTLFDTTGLNIHTNATWTGRGFLVNGILTTVVDDTVTVPSSCTPLPPPPATLHVVKHVVNNDGGTAVASSFTLHVMGSGSGGVSDVAGSPAPGAEVPGTSYTLTAGTYAVSENASSGYTQSFNGDCDASGSIVLASGDDKTCTITNDDIAVPVVPPPVVPAVVVPPVVLPPVVPPVVVPPVVVPPAVVTPAVITPAAPNTGAGGNAPETLLILALSAMAALGAAAYLRYRTH